jgi:hypothetical protein
MPLCVKTSASTVGFPRESMICLPTILVISGGDSFFSCSDCAGCAEPRRQQRAVTAGGPQRCPRCGAHHELQGLLWLLLDAQVEHILQLLLERVLLEVLLDRHSAQPDDARAGAGARERGAAARLEDAAEWVCSDGHLGGALKARRARAQGIGVIRNRGPCVSGVLRPRARAQRVGSCILCNAPFSQRHGDSAITSAPSQRRQLPAVPRCSLAGRRSLLHTRQRDRRRDRYVLLSVAATTALRTAHAAASLDAAQRAQLQPQPIHEIQIPLRSDRGESGRVRWAQVKWLYSSAAVEQAVEC